MADPASEQVFSSCHASVSLTDIPPHVLRYMLLDTDAKSRALVRGTCRYLRHVGSDSRLWSSLGGLQPFLLRMSERCKLIAGIRAIENQPLLPRSSYSLRNPPVSHTYIDRIVAVYGQLPPFLRTLLRIHNGESAVVGGGFGDNFLLGSFRLLSINEIIGVRDANHTNTTFTLPAPATTDAVSTSKPLPITREYLNMSSGLSESLEERAVLLVPFTDESGPTHFCLHQKDGSVWSCSSLNAATRVADNIADLFHQRARIGGPV